ncbi:MAG: chromosomal replication initiator protein DnaA [Gemmatimonadaceae bacterium]
MATDFSDTWSRLLAQARSAVAEDVYRTWLEPIVPIKLDGTVLTLSVPDQFSLEWTETKYADLLASFGPVALGHPITLTFQIDPERRERVQMDLFATKKSTALSTHNKDTIKPLLNDRYTFDHFIVGKSNELAAAAAHAVAQAPGHVYNPFFIYGQTGLGKTHLMQAIAHQLLADQPNMRIAYLSTEQFTNEMVASIQNRTTGDFRRRFREIDLLLIDDIHFLKGKEGTQEEFFHTFNALYEAGRQIVLTSDRAPADIGGLEARLISRFQWGMVADIELPDIEHRTAILQHKAELDHLEITFPPDVLRFIAESVSSSIRELEGSIIKILAYASLKHRNIDLSLAQEVLKTTPARTQALVDAVAALSVQQIQEAVARVWDISIQGLLSKTRTQSLTVPRQIAMLLTRTTLKLQLTEIGAAFGGRDHSTVIHSLTRAEELLTHDSTIRAKYHIARSLLGLPQL